MTVVRSPQTDSLPSTVWTTASAMGRQHSRCWQRTECYGHSSKQLVLIMVHALTRQHGKVLAAAQATT